MVKLLIILFSPTFEANLYTHLTSRINFTLVNQISEKL
jgi:hypothetical protein